MHNIYYWDVNTGTIKTTKYDSKDNMQYGDDIENRSPASTHLLEVFTGSSEHTTKTELETVELDLTNKVSPSVNDILTNILQNTPLPYMATAAAAARVNIPRKEYQRINRLTSKINNTKPAF